MDGKERAIDSPVKNRVFTILFTSNGLLELISGAKIVKYQNDYIISAKFFR
jgi:hypothetical protein